MRPASFQALWGAILLILMSAPIDPIDPSDPTLPDDAPAGADLEADAEVREAVVSREQHLLRLDKEIGRASCRERVCLAV